MNVEKIRKRLDGEFKPFSILTSDGRKYAVRQPYSFLVGAYSLAVLGRDGDIVTLDPLHVVALKDLPPKTKTTGRARS
jgi:hypothetical protein